MTRIIAEIGINHRGSADVARQLVEIAAAAGAWGVKFQYRNRAFYKSVTEIGDEILSDEIDIAYIAPELLLDVARVAKGLGLKAGISFFREIDSVDFGHSLSEFDFFKVPSAELLNMDLIRFMAGQGKPLILSTGGHTQAQIFRALDQTRDIPDTVYLHCIANYPVLLGNQQLAFMTTLAEHANAAVGYSSHDSDWEVCLFAIAQGAAYIERHLTLDRHGKGLDDSSSSGPGDFRQLCRFANAYRDVLGQPGRTVNQGEVLNMQNLGTSLYATRAIARGETVSLDNAEVRAPRKGLTIDQLRSGRFERVERTVEPGSAITALHFSPPKPVLDADLARFCNDRSLSLPIRLHDAKVIQHRFPIDHFELHLSYGEVARFRNDKAGFLAEIDTAKAYSIHLPDYIGGNRLIDPLTRDDETRTDSFQVVDTCAALAAELQQITGASVPIVGSFSRLVPEGKAETYQRLHEYLWAIRHDRGIGIYPQWLPRIAWYFGGAEILDLFCGADDIDHVRTLDMEICLDLSHLILSANHARADWHDWYAQLIPLARHLHIADAVGIDGEGIEFGQGDLGDVAPFLALPGRKVLEVWQGHLAEGDGFEKAITYLGNAHG